MKSFETNVLVLLKSLSVILIISILILSIYSTITTNLLTKTSNETSTTADTVNETSTTTDTVNETKIDKNKQNFQKLFLLLLGFRTWGFHQDDPLFHTSKSDVDNQNPSSS